nr:tyrosine-type recombinase/integrase [Amylibacter sp.]
MKHTAKNTQTKRAAAPLGNTRAAYRADWAHYTSWCRRCGATPIPPDAGLIAQYLTSCAAPQDGTPALAVSTIERRLAGLLWQFAQRGVPLDRNASALAPVLADIRRQNTRPPKQKAALQPDDISAMVATLSYSLRDLRDRAILLLGFAGGLRRSEITAIDVNRDDIADGKGWLTISREQLILTFHGKTEPRKIEITRGPTDESCPVHAVEQWLRYAKISSGPLFQRVTRDNLKPTGARLSDKHVVRLIKRTVRDGGIRSDLPEAERLALFSGHSFRDGASNLSADGS